VVPGPSEGGFSCPSARVGITYTHLQLKRRLREREECSVWNTILSHIFSKSSGLSLILACLRIGAQFGDEMVKETFVHTEN
jgi:hypothetical protein